MISLIDKQDTETHYSVSYDCGNHTVKVVRVGDPKIFTSGSKKQMSQLEIQTYGLDFNIEALVFDSGKIDEHSTTMLTSSSRGIITDEEILSEKEKEKQRERVKEYLGKFGREFSELFKLDEKLRLYLPTHFKDLEHYLSL